MTGAQLHHIRKKLFQLSESAFAELIGVSRSTIVRAESNASARTDRRTEYAVRWVLHRDLMIGFDDSQGDLDV